MQEGPTHKQCIHVEYEDGYIFTVRIPFTCGVINKDHQFIWSVENGYLVKLIAIMNIKNDAMFQLNAGF